MEIKVRLAEKGDFQKLLKLLVKASNFHIELDNEYPYHDELKRGSVKERKIHESKKLTENLKDKDTKIFIALTGQKIIGFMTVSLLKMNANCKYQRAEIENLFVLKKFRSKKIGRLLIKEAFFFLNSKNVKVVSLNVSSNNISAIKFYEKLGFRERLKTMTLISSTNKSH